MFLLLYDICIGRHKDIPYPKLKQFVYAEMEKFPTHFIQRL